MTNSTPPRDHRDRQVKNLQALLEVSKAMAGHLPLDDLLQVIVRKTTEVMDADRTSLFLFDEHQNTLWTKVAQGLDGSNVIRFPLGVGIAGDVAKTHKGANIPDAYADPRFDPTTDQLTGYHTRSILCLPMMSNERLIGVAEVLNKREGKVFDLEDEALLEALSAHAAIALERAQLTEAYIEKQRMEETLRLAHDIQMDLLPKQLPPFSNRSKLDLHAAMIPAQEVGGDLYDFFLIDEHNLFFVIGDVSGKGVPAALFMAVAKTLIKAFARKGLLPHEVLTTVNTELCLHNESCTFVTMFCGVLNTTTGEIQYTNGGHNPPLLVQQGGEGFYFGESGGMVLGILEDANFQTHTMQLKPGDSLFMYTDGVTEAIDAQSALFSEERLKQVFLTLRQKSSQEIIEGILEQLRQFSEGQPQFDDITMMNVKMV